jgi:predicted amidohydrolase YtcJ
VGFMLFRIQNPFDSHCHFLGTGQIAAGLSLKNLTDASDIKELKIEPHHYQQNWLVGFGWDQNLWPEKKFPTKEVLDSTFPNTPVFFSRNDGHCSWINTAAIHELKNLGNDFSLDPAGGRIDRDINGNPTGILFDQAHIHALQKIPYFSEKQQTEFLKISQSIFNRGGFTHVRDLSMTKTQWQLLSQMAQRKELTICVEGFVTIENLNDLPRALADVQWMKDNPSPLLRIQGIKLFLDGSLGSKTAYLSENYLHTNQKGILCWKMDEVNEVLKHTWMRRLDFAVHTIGDEAVHQMVQVARAVSAEGIVGRMHLEHVQVVRPETIQLMKPLHITCHMQPCHWLSDHNWLADVVSSKILKYSFQWEALRKNKIKLQFGSDSPIESTSLILTEQALIQSAKAKWAKLGDDWKQFHAHPDRNWTNSYTEFTDDKIHQVYFQGEPLI